MKFLKLFKNKLFVSLISVGAAVIIIAASVLSIMLPSYLSWKDYYDAVIAEREEQKYIQSLPLELTEITATLNEGVKYYANGRARPSKSDFSVTAYFTERGKESRKILKSDEFAMDFPSTFSRNGGAVTLSYTFVPEKKADDESAPEPVVKTTDVECSLENVVPVSIARTAMPYRIYYSDNMAFDPEGVTAQVLFNDGSKETVGSGEFKVSANTLVADTDKVSVSWERGGTSLSFDVPVTVVAAAEYDDGNILELSPAGNTYIAEGALTSEAKPTVRATYKSGNRLLLAESAYTVRGNTERASLIKKCVLGVYLANDPSVYTRVAAVVESGIEAEAATREGGTEIQTREYVLESGSYVAGNDVVAVSPQNGTTLSFSLKSDAVSYPALKIRAALKPSAADKNVVALYLANLMTLTVNGRNIALSEDVALRAKSGASGKYVFDEIELPKIVLNKAETNSVVISFTGEDADLIAIDRISLETGYKGEFYNSTEEYLVSNARAGITVPFENIIVRDWDRYGELAYGHSICSDGTYLYVLATRYAGGARPTGVQKYDPRTNEQVAMSATIDDAASEYTAGITYYDNKIIIYCNDGRKLYVEVDEFTEGCEFKAYHGFDKTGGSFVDWAPETQMRDVYYNSVKEKFAIFIGNSVYLTDKEGNPLKTFAVNWIYNGASRITGTVDYIYAIYTYDGLYSPVVSVFDWDGNYVGQITIPVSGDFLTESGVGNLALTNVQGLAVINGDFYSVVLKFSQPGGVADCCAYVKIQMPEITEGLEADLDMYDYLNACIDAEVSPSFTLRPSVGSAGTVSGTNGYGMGGAYDGNYLYIANNPLGSGNGKAVVSKVNLSTYEVEMQTEALDMDSAVAETDNSRLFIKDNVLYLVAGRVFSVALDEFYPGCELKLDEDMTALLAGDANRLLKSVHYSEKQQKYAIMDYSGNMFILDADGKQIGESVALSCEGYTASSLCGDDEHIYVSYKLDIQTVLPVDVYSFDGEKETTYNVPISYLGSSYNVQTIFMINGNLHVSFCVWTGDITFHDYMLVGSYSVFNA